MEENLIYLKYINEETTIESERLRQVGKKVRSSKKSPGILNFSSFEDVFTCSKMLIISLKIKFEYLVYARKIATIIFSAGCFVDLAKNLIYYPTL